MVAVTFSMSCRLKWPRPLRVLPRGPGTAQEGVQLVRKVPSRGPCRGGPWALEGGARRGQGRRRGRLGHHWREGGQRAWVRLMWGGRKWGLRPPKPQRGRRARDLHAVGDGWGPGPWKKVPAFVTRAPGPPWGRQRGRTNRCSRTEVPASATPSLDSGPGHECVWPPAHVCRAKPTSRGRGHPCGQNYGNDTFQIQAMTFLVLCLDRHREPFSSAALNHKRPDQTQTFTRKNAFSHWL